jgi:predicted PurR-regulated permease PerM
MNIPAHKNKKNKNITPTISVLQRRLRRVVLAVVVVWVVLVFGIVLVVLVVGEGRAVSGARAYPREIAEKSSRPSDTSKATLSTQ